MTLPKVPPGLPPARRTWCLQVIPVVQAEVLGNRPLPTFYRRSGIACGLLNSKQPLANSAICKIWEKLSESKEYLIILNEQQKGLHSRFLGCAKSFRP